MKTVDFNLYQWAQIDEDGILLIEGPEEGIALTHEEALMLRKFLNENLD